MIQTIILRKDRKDAASAAKFLNALPLDKAWRLEVDEYKPRRSDQQNRYLWGVVYSTIVKQFDGWRLDDVHEYMLGEHFGWEELAEGYKRPVRRSSRLNKQEFSDYIAFIQQRASEHGIYIPDPEFPT